MIETLDTFRISPLVIILKARQIGISWLLATYALLTALTIPYANVLLISKGEREAWELLSKCRFIYNNLPDWLKQPLSLDSVSTMGFGVYGSKISTLPCTGTAGIGEAATLVICDEWDKWDADIQVQNFASLKPTIDAGGKFIGVSTSDKQKTDSFFKQIIRGARAKENNFVYLFYPWNVVPGRDEIWYERQKADYPDYLLKQEYPSSLEEALSPLTGQGVFDEDVLRNLFDKCLEPDVRREYIYTLHPPQVGVNYVAGGDVGEGVGLDYSVLTILGTEGLQAEVCAVIHSNELKTDIFAYEVYKLCEEYHFPLLAIENNSLGVATLNKLVELGYPRLYSVKDKKGNIKKLGWTTSNFTRQEAIIELSNSVNNGSLITKFKPQVLEMMNFYFQDGKAQAAKGSHDDLVMSLMIANQMLKESPILKELPVIKLGGKSPEKTFSMT